MITAIFIILTIMLIVELLNAIGLMCMVGYVVNLDKKFKDALEAFGAGFASGLKRGKGDGAKRDKAAEKD